MNLFVCKPAARTTALLAAAAGMALWGAAMAAQAGDPPPPQPAAAGVQSGAAASAKPAKPDADERVICRNEDPPTGTTIGGGRVCRTQREWKQMEQDGQDFVNDMNAHNLGVSHGK